VTCRIGCVSDSTGTDVEPSGYADLLADLTLRVRQTQFRAARAANTEVMRLYWSQRGWSRANLLYMRRAAKAWPTESEFVQQAVGRLPWGHVTVLLDRLKTRDDRDWYAARAVDEGWSRSVLLHHIAVGSTGC
jgi:hypothetical protein